MTNSRNRKSLVSKVWVLGFVSFCISACNSGTPKAVDVGTSTKPAPVAPQTQPTQPAPAPAPVAQNTPTSSTPVVNTPVTPAPVPAPVVQQPQAVGNVVTQPAPAPVVVAPVAAPAPQTQPAAVVTQPPTVPVSTQGNLLIPATPFSNMESGYQATNKGFRAILKDSSGKVIASGPMTIRAAIDGYADDSRQGSAYSSLVLNVALTYTDGEVQAGAYEGARTGSLSICMANDISASYDDGSCKNLSGGSLESSGRPFQWINKGVNYAVQGNQISITGFTSGSAGEGSRSAPALALYHPTYGFAAPGKAFKDYQSPLVLDLNANGKMDLTDVWDESVPVAFDITASGKVSRTGWVRSVDGFLAIDVNKDGVINSGAELFGEYSVGKISTKENPKTFDDGFQALAQYDLNRDGKIDAKDAIFGKLVAWRDSNMDGVSQKEELMTMAQAKIKSFNLAYEKTSSVGKPLTVLDNEVRLKSTFTTEDGKSHMVADVWFKQRRNAEVTAKSAPKMVPASH